jgi:hypothetical protein
MNHRDTEDTEKNKTEKGRRKNEEGSIISGGGKVPCPGCPSLRHSSCFIFQSALVFSGLVFSVSSVSLWFSASERCFPLLDFVSVKELFRRVPHQQEYGMMVKRMGAEFLGTFWLVFGGCGSAVLAARFLDQQNQNVNYGIGLVGVSLAFGLTVLTMAYALGHIFGNHWLVSPPMKP